MASYEDDGEDMEMVASGAMSSYERSKARAAASPESDDASFWTTDMVIGYVRRSLLEEGVDTRAISDLCEALEDQQIDGQDLLSLDEQKIRYDLGCGALSVRRKFMEVINNLRPAIDPRSAGAATGHRGGGGGRREERESVGSVTDDEHDQEAFGGIDTRDRKSRSADGPRGGEMKEEERKMRQAEAKEAWRNEEVLPLLRVLAAVAMMSVLYNVLGQSMPYWHVRSVRMRGPGEKINWITRMGLWGYESHGHYLNENMFGAGFRWEDDYSDKSTYEESKWQCAPPTNKDIKDFCGGIRSAEAFECLSILCASAAMFLSLLAIIYDQPLGCSRYFIGVSISQCLFAIAGLICVDAAFTAQLQRYGDHQISATSCEDRYLTYALAADDDWYTDDWAYNQLAQNDDRFEYADVRCGYHFAFVLQCFVPFLSLLQAWLFWKLHTVAPGSGYEFGLFLRRKKQDGHIEVHMRTPGRGGGKAKSAGGNVYRVVKHREAAEDPAGSRMLSKDYV